MAWMCVCRDCHPGKWGVIEGTADVMTNSIGMKLKLIPAGEFLMGSPADETDGSDNEAQHRVKLTKPFYLGIHEVTRGEFAAFVSDTKYKTEAESDGKGGYGFDELGKVAQKPEYTWRSPGFSQTDDHPVVNVSWNDAQKFIDWLKRTEGKQYRLPTEAEWEYSCRADSATKYWNGNDAEKLALIGNVADGTAKAKYSNWVAIAATDGFVFTGPVGSFSPNSFGLYDMHGNVWEWCSDWYSDAYYTSSPGSDPSGPSTGSRRVLRGGSWNGSAGSCRSANRRGNAPSLRNSNFGFRLALSPSGK